MWVARDKSGCLHLFSDKPERQKIGNLEYWRLNLAYSILSMDDKLFPELTWEDEPIEVDFQEAVDGVNTIRPTREQKEQNSTHIDKQREKILQYLEELEVHYRNIGLYDDGKPIRRVIKYIETMGES